MEKITPIIIPIITSSGYVQKEYGYVKEIGENTHWITLFKDSGELQMYAYFTEDEEFDKIYDTGIVSVNEYELQMLIKILAK